MRVAVSSTGLTLDDEVDPRFGRCRSFVLVDPDSLEYEALDNTSAAAAGGAGISAAQMVAGKGVQAVLTGNCGPNAYQVLSAAGVQIVTGVSGKVRDAVAAYKSGQYQASSGANVADHFGIGYGGSMGGGMGMGRGMGRGMGGGMGRGMGRGMGAGMSQGMTSPSAPASAGDLRQEIEGLRTEAQSLKQQLANIERRIEELQKRT
ncbi:MAG: NifB/NifX family molybdenum-iron cluster-binding protein [Chloroflexota bacterium]